MHICHPSYLGKRDRKMANSRPAWASEQVWGQLQISWVSQNKIKKDSGCSSVVGCLQACAGPWAQPPGSHVHTHEQISYHTYTPLESSGSQSHWCYAPCWGSGPGLWRGTWYLASRLSGQCLFYCCESPGSSICSLQPPWPKQGRQCHREEVGVGVTEMQKLSVHRTGELTGHPSHVDRDRGWIGTHL